MPTGPRSRAVIWWLPLGQRDYALTWELQKRLVEARHRREVPDCCLTVEHPHVITLGRSTDPENIRERQAPDGTGEVPLFEIERGGDVTYHGPGQLVAYFVFDLGGANRDLHRFLRQVEQVQIELLTPFGVRGGRLEDKTGVWIGGSKIGSVGIAVRHWVTYHGFALNVATDLRFFTLINPCGFDAAVMTSLSARLGRDVDTREVEGHLPAALANVFEREVVRIAPKRLPEGVYASAREEETAGGKPTE